MEGEWCGSGSSQEEVARQNGISLGGLVGVRRWNQFKLVQREWRPYREVPSSGDGFFRHLGIIVHLIGQDYQYMANERKADKIAV